MAHSGECGLGGAEEEEMSESWISLLSRTLRLHTLATTELNCSRVSMSETDSQTWREYLGGTQWRGTGVR